MSIRIDQRPRFEPIALLLVLCAVAGCTTSFGRDDLRRRDGQAETDAARIDAAVDGSDAGFDATDALVRLDAMDVADAHDVVVTDTGPSDVTPDAPDVPCGAGCAAGSLCCDSNCTNPLLNASHCGACGNACPGTTCAAGSCTNICRLGFLDCDRNAFNGCEANVGTDPVNCGACGVSCGTGRPCVAGRCGCPAGMADCDGNPANGCESNTSADVTHCGDCMTACRANQRCAAGVCGCEPGFANCDGDPSNGCEIDTRTSAMNCGACGTSCGTNSSCSAGSCVCSMAFLRCPADATACLVSRDDRNNCGACGVRCDPSTAPLCTVTGCATSCGTMARCGDACVDMNSDPMNCGACGVACAAHPNAIANCRESTCEFLCTPGFADCNATASDGCEVDLTRTTSDCGACGNACGVGRVCVAGRCACSGGLRDCGTSCAECCTDLNCADSDPCTDDSCSVAGTCRHAPCGAGQRCCGSACRGCCGDSDCTGIPGRGCGTDGMCSVCLSGFRDCDGNAGNGCETDARSEVSNCGECGVVCGFANASAACIDGSCRLGTCTAPFADCDGSPGNGCEANLNSSASNCGACGTICPAATPVCMAGRCQATTCAAGRGDCDGASGNGCETDLQTSAADCGACGNACSFPHATASCASGLCALGTCEAGFGNCDAIANNGCETNVTGSITHCGACGTRCTFTNASAACNSGACMIAACAPGFGNCDGAAANGCEADVLTSLANCGSCGTACAAPSNAVATCTAGVCAFTCSAGFGDCDGDPSNGCEAPFDSPDSCGGCGQRCVFANASASCVAGTCALDSCTNRFLNCDGNSLNGCETNGGSDIANCGSCGMACSPPGAIGVCMSGQCNIGACRSGFANCDALRANGCERECGAGRSCAGPASCAMGWRTMAPPPAGFAARQFAFYALAPQRHELLIWGGTNGAATPSFFNDGVRYNWTTDTWSPMSAPPASVGARAFGNAVWTGTELFVWGGRAGSTFLDSGALYNPQSDSWRAIPTMPAARAGYQAFYTGTRVVIFGGESTGTIERSAWSFDPSTSTWTRLADVAVPGARQAAAFTGTEVIVVGGDASPLCAGSSMPLAGDARWLPVAGAAWTALPSAGAPTARWFASGIGCSPTGYRSVWTGAELFVWGGFDGAGNPRAGALYSPATDLWRAISDPPVPSGLRNGAFLPVLVWTGSEVLGWGASVGAGAAATSSSVVWRYAPSTNMWFSTAPTGGPPPIHEGAAYGWTGNELIVWGGRTTATSSSGLGGRYAP